MSNHQQITTTTTTNFTLPPLPPSLIPARYEFKITGQFPSQFNNIQSQCYHPSQQVLILGGSNGNLYFVGGDAHYYITLSDEYSIENIQNDEQFPIIYCLCKNHQNSKSILISYDYLKKQIVNQVHFNDHQNVTSIKYYKGYLLITTIEFKNNIYYPYVKYMSTSNFKFIQSISLLHPIFNAPNIIPPSNLLINCVEPHPTYDHVISVGYSNGETVIYYIYHVQNTNNNSISTNLNCIVIPSQFSVTSLNWHAPNIIICGYSNGSFTLYEINHPQFTFSLYYEMNMLKGCTNFITSYNQFIIFGLGSDTTNADSGIYYLKMNYEVRNIEFIRHVWCDQKSIENITLLKSVFDNPNSNSLMASVIYGENRNVLVLDLFEKMIYPQKELQLFNLEKYSVPTPFYSTKDLICNNKEFIVLKTSGMDLSNLVYNTVLNNFNQEQYRRNMLEYYLRPVNRWNILGMKYTQYRVDINVDKDNYILVKLSDQALGSAVELYLCNPYFNDIRYIYTIGNQASYKTMCKWSDSVIILASMDGNLDFLHIPSATIFTHDITEKSPTVDNSTNISEAQGNNFQGIIAQVAKYNFNVLKYSNDNPIIQLVPIQVINQLLIAYQDGTIKIVSLSTSDISSDQIIENEFDKHFGSIIFELNPSDMKSSHLFVKSILPKKDVVSHIECSIYRGNLYAFLGFASGKVMLIQLYDLDYMTRNYHKLSKYIHEARWKDLADHICPFVIYENSANNFGKVIDIYTVNDIYNEYNISKMVDEKYLPPMLRSEYVPNSIINSPNGPICYTIHSTSLTSVFGTVKNNMIAFPINSASPLTILFQLKKTLPISFNFVLDILDIKFETLSKIEEMANYRIIVNGVPFEFDINSNHKLVDTRQVAVVVTGEEYRVYVRNETKFECIGSAPSGYNCVQDQYITKMNFKVLSHSIHDKEAEFYENQFMNSKMYNLCDVDYLCEYIDSVEIYNNLSFSDLQNSRIKQPNIVGYISKAGIPPLGQSHGYTRSKFIMVVKEKGIEEYVLSKPMISLKKFSIKEGRKYNHNNIISSSSLEYVRSNNQSLILLDNQNNLMMFSLKPSSSQSKSIDKIFTQKISNLPISSQPFKISTFDSGRDLLIYNNDHVVYGTLFDSKSHKSTDILEPIIYTIDYKPPTKAIGESIVGFFKSFTKSTPSDKDVNETFWKICTQLQREDLNLVKQLVVNNIVPSQPSNNSDFDDNEKTIISSFLSKELELKNKPIVKPLPQPTTTSSATNASTSSSSNLNNLYTRTNRELLFGDDENDDNIKITSSNSSMKRSELNNRIEETKLQMSENLRKLNEREEKLREINEKTSEMSGMASSFAANAQKLNQRSGFFGF
ncbi:predicted protein [Naegleria gruberi]|uniref:Predicted protein n=1 Tax=Naegleria gruberi TaxID=5762 RepID=D2V9M7_NAEGR|nr:uncharacterized protein NAEGRDRAFT_65494 [Naegleria gruberi]EFC46493.1 predicted protein [Naegleria gruberi]|eukprot:XP_002679237.1 predicted protein [Naegleria gruberi strain NEG-M]